jgi:hypothetical protein
MRNRGWRWISLKCDPRFPHPVDLTSQRPRRFDFVSVACMLLPFGFELIDRAEFSGEFRNRFDCQVLNFNQLPDQFIKQRLLAF